MPSYVYGCGPCCERNSQHSSLFGPHGRGYGPRLKDSSSLLGASRHSDFTSRLKVELFERTLLGLRHKHKDHAKGAYVKPSVETKGACWSHGAEHAWESDGQHRGPKKASGHSPRHTDLYQND